MSRNFILFLAIGGLAAAVNVVARILFNYVVPFEIAIVLAFPVALTVAFALNRKYVFHAEHGKSATQYARFLFVNLVALVQVWLVSVGLSQWLFPTLGFTWHPETVAHAIGVASPIVTSYLAHKHFSFR